MSLVSENRAESFLQIIRRAERGRLKIYLGYSPGVGKTYQMLQEAHRLKAEGVDLVVGVVETHGRSETAKLVDGLELIPRRKVEYHGVTMEEMDLEAILQRKPQIVLVDELAHTNLPGSKNTKRYQDVQDLRAVGIHVISTLNLQHLESLYNTVEKLIGVKVTERLPDSVLAEADQIVNVDLTPEDLQKRLQAGKVYRHDRVATALDNFFTAANLEQLRELTLREVASQIDIKRREILQQERNQSPDQVMVCLSSRGPNSGTLLRYGSRLAGRLNRNWYAVYVQTPSEEPTLIDAMTQRLLSDNLTLANQLGAMVFTFRGEDIVDTILRFAREYRVGHVVIGRPGPITFWQQLRGRRSVAERLIHEARGISVVVIDAEAEERFKDAAEAVASAATTPAASPQAPATGALSSVLDPTRVIVWTEPVTREEILRDVVNAAHRAAPELDPQAVLRLLHARETQGSMFLNEGVALPHVRVPNLSATVPILGLVRGGVIDVATERPIELVFGLMSPENQPTEHLKLLAAAARAFQDRNLRRALAAAKTPQQAYAAIEASEV
ncbi:MAG TPA: PTS sugar transporter subunit IIA [Phycisphaerae bacterium]|nr:PTS sugar transporter subunit IIA [Phycisphaerae bacterium]